MNFENMRVPHVWGVLSARAPVDGKWVQIQKVCQVCHEEVDCRVVVVNPLDVSPEFEEKCQGELLTIRRHPWHPRGDVTMISPDLLGSHACPGRPVARPRPAPEGPLRPPGEPAEPPGGAPGAEATPPPTPDITTQHRGRHRDAAQD